MSQKEKVLCNIEDLEQSVKSMRIRHCLLQLSSPETIFSFKSVLQTTPEILLETFKMQCISGEMEHILVANHVCIQTLSFCQLFGMYEHQD